MSLSSAWSVGLSGLATASGQISVTSRNIARASDVSATRKVAEQGTGRNGTVRIEGISRAADKALLDGSLKANADASRESAISQSLETLYASVRDPDLEASPAAKVANLEVQLRTLANNPADTTTARSAVDAAREVVGALKDASAQIASVRASADGAIADAVVGVNASLAQLEVLNKSIVVSSQSGGDVTDDLDRRDAILAQLSQWIGVRTVAGKDNGIAVYADGGAVLFDNVARKVSFEASGTLVAGGSGASVVIDGADVTGANAVMPLRSGSIAGLIEIRDVIAPIFQKQIDELARGLISAFADPDRSGSGKPDLPGLFTSENGVVPVNGTVQAGLASKISVNAAIDPAQGGDARLLRDGGASAPSDPDYKANRDASAGYSGRLLELIKNMSAARSFDPDAGLGTSANVKEYAASSAAWLDGQRKSNADRLELSTSVRDRAVQNLQSATGINLDQEMTELLTFERSFQASSRLIATVDQMYNVLFDMAAA